MGAGDGRVVGVQVVLDSGPAEERWNLVVVAEGYREDELPSFAAAVDAFVSRFVATPPFDQLTTGINVYRVDVGSAESGADDPVSAGGTGATARTFFDASFGKDGVRRLLVVDDALVLATVGAVFPAWHMIMVMVNSNVYGGSGGSVAVFSKADRAEEIALHEIGHTAFHLADEYPYYEGCDTTEQRNRHPAVEPSEPNVTIEQNRDLLKWRDLISPSTAVPTMTNPDCGRCDPRPSPVADGTVGAFEGAHYYHCGAFRPEFTCRMRSIEQPFCRVCSRVIIDALTDFVPGG